MKKLLLFGAGKIGRSFIAQLFSQAGYETVFIDIDKNLVDLINEKKKYNVVVKDKNEKLIRVENVRAIHISEKKKIIEVIADTTILSTSVGLAGLKKVFPLLAEGLIKRFQNKSDIALDIIIAENIRNADQLFAKELKKYLSEDYPLEELVGLVQCSIGKMVPIMTQKDLDEDALQIFAESYNYLPVDARAFKNSIPKVEGLAPKNNIKAWVDQKSFIHNLGHATAAYFGYLDNPNEILLWKVLEKKSILEKTRATMLQSANILLKQYPYEFTQNGLEEHIDDLLERFQNRLLGDTIYRVGCDLYRKLSKVDRLAGAIDLALKKETQFDKILEALVCGFHFRATDESGNLFPSDRKFMQELNETGFKDHFKNITGIENPDILKKAISINEKIITSEI